MTGVGAMAPGLPMLALVPLMLFGANPPAAQGHVDTIGVSLCFGDAQVAMRIPRRDDDPSRGATACHAAAVMPKKKRA